MEEVKKRCCLCKKDKPLDQFYKSNGRHLHGVTSKCKKCFAQYNSKRWEKIDRTKKIFPAWFKSPFSNFSL